jgi:thioredoxin
MSDHELEKIRLKKAEEIMKLKSMPKGIINIHGIDQFNQILKENSNMITIVDFWAIWCGPCMSFAPTFEKLQQEHANEFIFMKVNVDENGEIAQKYRISAIPTTLFVKDAKVIHQVVGAMNYNKMKSILQQLKDISH